MKINRDISILPDDSQAFRLGIVFIYGILR
jgi:hypothetical protein